MHAIYVWSFALYNTLWLLWKIWLDGNWRSRESTDWSCMKKKRARVPLKERYPVADRMFAFYAKSNMICQHPLYTTCYAQWTMASVNKVSNSEQACMMLIYTLLSHAQRTEILAIGLDRKHRKYFVHIISLSSHSRKVSERTRHSTASPTMYRMLGEHKWKQLKILDLFIAFARVLYVFDMDINKSLVAEGWWMVWGVGYVARVHTSFNRITVIYTCVWLKFICVCSPNV